MASASVLCASWWPATLAPMPVSQSFALHRNARCYTSCPAYLRIQITSSKTFACKAPAFTRENTREVSYTHMSPSPQIGCGNFPEYVVRLLRRKREEGPSPGSYRHCRRGILHCHVTRFMASRYFPALSVPLITLSLRQLHSN